MKKFYAMTMVAAMVTTMLSGCGANQTEQSNSGGQGNAAFGDTVKIGVLAPLTGGVATYGTTTRNGIVLAFEEINAAGGVCGLQIEPIILDEKGDVNEAVNAYNMLVDKGIVALLGDVTSKPTIAVAEYAAEDRMPMITATGTAAEITEKGDNVFRTCFMDPAQGEAMAVFAADGIKANRVAILYNLSDEYSQGVATAFESKASALGLQVVAKEGYSDDSKDFNTQITTILAQDVDTIFVSDYYNKDALIASQIRAQGFDGALIGPDGWDGSVGAVDSSNVAVLNNCFFSNHYATSDESEKVQNFLKNYKAKYNEDPTSFAALGYDTAYVLAAAIEKAGSADKEAIISAMKEAAVDGVTGHITFDSNGNAVKEITVIEIKDGAYTFHSKITADGIVGAAPADGESADEASEEETAADETSSAAQ